MPAVTGGQVFPGLSRTVSVESCHGNLRHGKDTTRARCLRFDQLRLRACDAVEARTGRLLLWRRTAALTATAGGQDRCLMVRASG